MDYTSIKVGQLPTAEISGSDYFPHEVAGLLKKATITDLATFINASEAVGFRAVSVSDGETLPATEKQEFILVGPGTYNNVGGGPTITVTEELNALVSNETFWFVGVEIPIDAPPGNAIWGQIIGTLSNQTDLQNILNLKADLVDGKVPSSQLPSYVDDVIEVANYAALPVTGETGKIYLTLDNNKIYRWSGSVYIEIAAENAVWGQIVGTLSNQTDLQNALNAKLNLTGGTVTGTLNVDGSGATTPAITSIFNTGINRLLTPVLRLYGPNNISSKYIELFGSLATTNRTIQFPDASGTVALDDNLVHITGTETISGAKTFSSTLTGTILQLQPNNTAGTNSNYIGQTMATNDNWKIYGSTITSDYGEMVFELGDNAVSDGQRFRFFYNETGGGGGASKSPFILNYNDATFDTNATFSGNVGIGGSLQNWDSVYSVLQIKNSAVYASTDNIAINQNLYSIGENTKYINSNYASKYEQNSGAHWWFTSPVGTSGANATINQRMILTNSGNLGIGITPSWGLSGYVSLEIGKAGNIYSTTTTGNSTMNIVSNLYHNGSNWIYKNSTGASLIGQNSGAITFETAPSGTSGSTATITEIMRLTNDGKLGLGTSTFIYSPKLAINSVGQNTLAIQTTDSVQGSTGSVMYIGNGATTGNTYGVIRTLTSGGTAAGNLVLQPDGAGNVGIGATIASSLLHIESGFGSTGNALRLQNTTAATTGNRLDIDFWFKSSAWTNARTAQISAVTTSTYWPDTSIVFSNHSQSSPSGLTERMRIDANGTALFKRTSSLDPSYAAGFEGAIFFKTAANGNNTVNFFNASTTYVASIVTNASSITYGTGSDYRLKEDLKDFNGLEKISKIKVYDFKFIKEGDRMDGVLAHELQEVVPYAVSGEKDELDEKGNMKIQNVDYSKLTPILVKAIQELKAEIEILKNK